MKKNFLKLLALSVVLGITFSTTSVQAQSTSLKEDAKLVTVYQKSEIKDINTLFYRAKNNINDSYNDSNVATNSNDPSNEFNSTLSIANNSTRENLNINKDYSTRQLLKVEKNTTTGEQINHYAETIIVPMEVNSNNELVAISPQVIGSIYDSSYDSSSYCVLTYGTIYYDTVQYSGYNNHTYRALKSVSGGWNILDSSVSVRNKHVRTVTHGGLMNGSYDTEPEKHFYPTGSTFYYDVSMNYVDIDVAYGLGMIVTSTVNRGGSSWTATLSVGSFNFWG
ncbi:hypothetical protein [Clostridium sp. BJN0013]|uniref:hypothetical protein n=1 Tax=Clostridium sp. BJN0013 TaxID=3236840 RepID=UPI0034C63E09